MTNGVIWITKGGKHIPITEKTSNSKNSSKAKKLEELRKKLDNEKNIFKKGAIREEIDMLKMDFKGTKEEYRKYIDEEIKRRDAEYQKEKENRIAEFKKQTNENNDYRMTHRPTETGFTADNLLQKGKDGIELPKDIYEHPEYYSSNKVWVKETMQQLNAVRNNPDGEVTIYRATPGNKINEGDWITLSKSYAQMHLESQLNGKGNLLEQKVKAKDIQYAGDLLEEWGYFPQKNNDWLRNAFNEYKKEHPKSKMTFNNFKNNAK